jgi:predicted aspartyl protease
MRERLGADAATRRSRSGMLRGQSGSGDRIFSALATGALVLACGMACAVATQVSVFLLPASQVRVPPPAGALGAEERFARGQFLEVQSYLDSVPRSSLEKNAGALALYGRVLLARGDFEAAWPVLQRALRLESRASRRGEIEWDLSQGAILWNEFGLAEEYARAAVNDGHGLVPGFLHFLEAMRDVDLYAGPAIGEEHESGFSMKDFDLLRVPVRVNGFASAAIIDSGAVYTILTESFARQAGIREIPDSGAYGRGLHKKEFPVSFGVLDRLEFGGFSLIGVPVMLMPDDALLFETTRGQFPVPFVLGLHLLKEFTTDIDYQARRLRLTRTDFRVPKREAGQNLFFHGGRMFVRTSIDRNGFYQFLFDTGSEPTLMTSAGLMRAGLPSSSKLYPRKVYGLGQSSVEWGVVHEVTLGVAGYGARFKDIAVKEDENAFEDGVLGNSFLKYFRVRIDFSRMVLSLRESR